MQGIKMEDEEDEEPTPPEPKTTKTTSQSKPKIVAAEPVAEKKKVSKVEKPKEVDLLDLL